MDSLNMCTGKAAAVIALGAGASLFFRGGRDAPDPAGGESAGDWRETGFLNRALLCIITGVCLLVVGWLYKLLFSPLELLKEPDDVGYIAEDGRSRARAANEVRRRRKVGDLPPVYPNGWFRVLDSHMLQRGEVRNVSVVGTTPLFHTEKVMKYTNQFIILIFIHSFLVGKVGKLLVTVNFLLHYNVFLY